MFKPESLPQEEQEPANQELPAEKPKVKKISRRAFLRKSAGVATGAAVGLALGEVASAMEKTEKEKLAEEMEATRKADFEFIKNIIEKRGLEEKLEYLQEKFGKNTNKVFWEIKRLVDLSKQVQQDEKDGVKDLFVDPDNPALAVKTSVFSYGKDRWADKSKKEKQEQAKPIKVEGFNAINEIFKNHDAEWQGDSDKKVANAMAKRYPLQWLASVKEVYYINENSPISENYGIKGFSWATAHAGGIGRPDKGKVVFHKTNNYNFEAMLSVLDHELAHQNDWASSVVLSEPQRAELLYDAAQALEHTKEFQSDYVSAINNEDKQLEAYTKVTEYWATAVGQYMEAGPEKYKKTNPTEYALVKKWFDIINDIKE